jgi:hypothetical protein
MDLVGWRDIRLPGRVWREHTDRLCFKPDRLAIQNARQLFRIGELREPGDPA